MQHFNLQTNTKFSCTLVEENNVFSYKQNKGLRDAKSTIFPVQRDFSKGIPFQHCLHVN